MTATHGGMTVRHLTEHPSFAHNSLNPGLAVWLSADRLDVSIQELVNPRSAGSVASVITVPIRVARITDAAKFDQRVIRKLKDGCLSGNPLLIYEHG